LQVFPGIFVVTAFEIIGRLPSALVLSPRELDHQFDVEITTGVGFIVGHAFAFKAEFLPALTPRWNL
jgi:hypothetical protein